jgi:hypothetical protein
MAYFSELRSQWRALLASMIGLGSGFSLTMYTTSAVIFNPPCQLVVRVCLEYGGASGTRTAGDFRPSEVVLTAIFPIYPATLGASLLGFSKGPEKGPQNRPAVGELPRTSTDTKTLLFY